MSRFGEKSSFMLYALIILSAFKPYLVWAHFSSPQPSESDVALVPGSQQEYHPTMSCFVCSTMDYDNPADNLCRIMRPHHQRSTPNLYQQTSSSHHYIQSATTTTTTTSTTTAATPNGDLLDANNSGPYDSYHSTLPTSITSKDHSSNGTSMSSGDYHGHYANNIVATKAAAGGQILPPSGNTTSSPLAQHQHHLRQPPPSNFIRTRPCFDDENFCSIVSVVRIEFVNDNLSSKFWAMERNCSKSCNTGCMLIGERVRLRVCSQCCRTPNCNTGSGGSRTDHILLNFHHMIIIISALIIILNLQIGTYNH